MMGNLILNLVATKELCNTSYMLSHMLMFWFLFKARVAQNLAIGWAARRGMMVERPNQS